MLPDGWQGLLSWAKPASHVPVAEVVLNLTGQEQDGGRYTVTVFQGKC